MNMTREEVLVRFCALSVKVMKEHTRYSQPADCFCSCFCSEKPMMNFQFSENIIKFIEEAVEEKLNK